MNRNKFNQDLVLKLVLASILVALFFQGVFAYFVDSEIWSITSSQMFFNNTQDVESVYSKPLFYLILRCIYFLPIDSFSHLMVAKVIFSANFMWMNWLVFQIIQKTSKNTSFSFLAVLMLLSFPTWISEAFRVRADFLALTMSLLALRFFVEDRDRRNLSKIGFFILASVLLTPKSIAWNLPLLVFFALQTGKMSGLRQLGRRKWAIWGAISICCGLSALVWPQVQMGVATTFQYFATRMGVLMNFSKIGFLVDSMFVLNSLYADKVFWLWVCALTVLSLTLSLVKKKSYQILAPVMALTLFLLSTPKTAFFWSVQVLIIFLCSVPGLQWLFERLPRWVHLGFAGVLLLHGGFWMMELHDSQSGHRQFEFIKRFDTALDKRDLQIFDSMGMLPRRSYLLKYADFTNPDSLKYIEEAFQNERPTIVFNTARISSVFPELKEKYLDKEYVDLGNEIYILSNYKNSLDFQWNGEDPLQLFNQRVLWHP